MRDKRRYQRFRLWLPARLEGEGGQTRLAVGHDMSQKGSLLVTSGQLEVGAPVTLHVSIPPEGGQERPIHARIVRVEPNTKDPEGLWPYRVAVEFVDAAPELEDLLREQAANLEGLTDKSEQPG
ncbi:MAG: PilZ domain-containing protein [Deltaproteobacteria bacterium]|nr:PilZ domain-containing protein [Deltaproteobacteria bacterium]